MTKKKKKKFLKKNDMCVFCCVSVCGEKKKNQKIENKKIYQPGHVLNS